LVMIGQHQCQQRLQHQHLLQMPLQHRKRHLSLPKASTQVLRPPLPRRRAHLRWTLSFHQATDCMVFGHWRPLAIRIL
jgi:hypothetical protein